MPILESSLEGKASKYAEKIGYISLKVTVAAQRGWPDHLYINRHGHHVWIEFKKLGEKPSKLQNHRLKQLTERGVTATWSDDWDTTKDILDANVDTPRLPA